MPATRAVTTQAPLPVRRGYVDGPWGQIHYYACGEGEPVLLAHQSPVCARQFERGLPLLAARGLRAIAVDTPGYGNSDPPPAPPSIDAYAATFTALLDGLGLERAHCLGHHTGAGILCRFAVASPGRVQRLVLNGPPLIPAEVRDAFLADPPVGPPQPRRDGSHLTDAWARRLHFTPGWTDLAAMHRRLIDELWAGDAVGWGHNAAFHYDMAPDLHALTVPTLIFTNSGDDLYEASLAARALRPDFAFAALADGTHDIVDEQPAAWAAVVADFLCAGRVAGGN